MLLLLLKKHGARYMKHMHKFGIEYKKTVENAEMCEKQNGNIWGPMPLLKK